MLAACKAAGEKLAKIVGKGTLVKKTTTAMFDGKDAGTSSDTVDCK